MKIIDSYAILDFSAVAKHCYNIAPNGNPVEVFVEEYLLSITEEFSPRNIIVAHDGGNAYRQSIYPDYKAKRLARKEQEKGTPEDIKLEKYMTTLKQILASIGCIQGRVEGVEADDLIAHICEGLGESLKSIFTVDADLMQLANKTTQVYIRNCPIVPNNPDDEYATKFINMLYSTCGEDFPKYINLAKSILGDSADEYIGIKGFGEKLWIDMCNLIENDGLDELLGCLENKNFTALSEALGMFEKEPKCLRMLFDNRSEWRTAYALAKLHPDLCVKPWKKKITEIVWYKRVPSVDKLTAAFSGTGCEDYVDTFSYLVPKYVLIDSTSNIGECLKQFKVEAAKGNIVSFDYETYDDHHPNFLQASKGKGYVDTAHSKPTGVSICYGRDLEHCFYLTVDHKDSNNLDSEVIVQFLQAKPDGVIFVAHNSFFEIAVTEAQLGFLLENVHDTQIMAMYVDENAETSALKFRSKKELNYNQMTYGDTLAQVDGAKTMQDLTAEQTVNYGCDDSVVTGHLYDLYKLRMQLEKTWDFYSAYEPLTTNALVSGYLQGVRIDWTKQDEIHQEDILIVKENIDKLRKILSKHCLEVNEQSLAGFVESDKQTWRLQYKKKYAKLDDEALAKEAKGFEGKSRREQISALVDQDLEAKVESLRKSCAYVPYTESRVVPEFVPTEKTINKVIEKLGFETRIAAVSNVRIREWLGNEGTFNLEDGGRSLEPLQKEFTDLFAAASTQLRLREGAEYDKFCAFCSEHVGAVGRLVKSGTELNLNSPPQVQAILYTMIGAKVRNRSFPQRGSFRQVNKLQGSPATDETAIKTSIAEDFDSDNSLWQFKALTYLLNAKTAMTRISLYHEPYKLWKHPEDNLLYPFIRNFNTKTGRPTGNSPNILQVSKHKNEAVMRSIFLPREDDHIMICIDFSGQELRILASSCEDENMLSAYIGVENAQKYLADTSISFSNADVANLNDLRDIHTITGSGIAPIFGIPKCSYEEFKEHLVNEDSEYHKKANKVRKKPAKTTNFLIAYMGTPPSLAEQLIIPLRTAEKMMQSTHKLYPKLSQWQKASADLARRKGYSETAYGKRRHITNDIFSKDGSKRGRMERQVNNAEIQGTAADILKIVLAESWRQKVWTKLGAVMLAPVYDEIVASVPISVAHKYIETMTAIMNLTPPNSAVPMVADVSLGIDWQKQIEIGTAPTEQDVANAIKKAKES